MSEAMKSTVNWNRSAFLLLTLLAAFRIFYAWVFPYDISGDEAYYWEWGRHLDWCYFTKPPLIGWIMALAGSLGGHTETGLRVASTLLGTASLAVIYELTKRMFSPRAGFFALCAAAAGAGNAALNIFLTIDAPLMLLWSGAMLAFWGVLAKRTAGWGVLLICCLGFGLLAKQMMLVFYPIALAVILTTKETRGLLKSPWLWLGTLASLAFLIPPVLWNAGHDWVTFSHTGEHFQADTRSMLDVLSQVGEFIGSFIGLLSPVTALLFIAALVAVARRWKQADLRGRFCFLFSAPALFVFLLFSFHRTVNPNWPLVFYTGGLLLLAGRVDEKGGRQLTWFKGGIALGVLLAIAFYAMPFAVNALSNDITKYPPLKKVIYWEEYASVVVDAEKAMPNPERTMLIVAGAHHRYSALLAFYHPEHPTVYRWPKEGRETSQYEFWPGPQEKAGWDALIVVPNKASLPDDLRSRFLRVEPLRQVTVPPTGQRVRTYSFWRGTGWRDE